MTYFPLQPLMTVAASTPVQLFIAWRIIVISEKRHIPFIIGLFSLISTGGAIWLAYTVVDIREFSRKAELHWPALTWLIAAMIADVIIAASLGYSLAKRRTGIAQTDDTINRIIRMTIQTGLVTAIFTILEMICFLLIPNSTLNFVWDLALSKLYTNALLSTLNARTSFGMSTNVLFTEKSINRDDIIRSNLHCQGDLEQVSEFFKDLMMSKSLDISPSGNGCGRTVENIEIGVVPVKEVREI
ncbi:hypothetical protein AGABI1DRAFT_108490 [Agaricus bisporus var. burnettii JB137-S8]|uniref:DUF6534 domain-containing protein n=1 Tax=Agaricus bisporus var. burnettii (strain JB137-S8 / ATCC MYA-4627 / FGSC 10392) TaxID=597362 RepID=K5XQ20_AGABU|nr:uncharacterized protein AGABI1DRAFT_108490 [Agaricus bisporus var. burnettii JB137-S8]EKM76860.1 hypothetical protein AGABI1DRAFT_108490 [Agaricus bisporus var. burnettii JB137-S8]